MPPSLNPNKDPIAQYANSQQVSSTYAPKPISVSDATSTTSPYYIPPPSSPTDYSSLASAGLQALTGANASVSSLEDEGDQIKSQTFDTLDALDQEATRKRELELEADLPSQRSQIKGLVSRLQALDTEALKIPLQVQEEARGRGITVGGAAPTEMGRLRSNTIERLGLIAQGQFLQGQVSEAESTIKDALDAEFEPLRLRLQTLDRFYSFNKDALERADKKRADALAIAITERDRILRLDETNRKEIYDIGLTAQKYGADQATVQKIFNSHSREEAVSNAGSFLVDPQAAVDLENARLQNVLTKTQINKSAYELQLLQKYGGMTPAQYSQYLRDEKKLIDEEKDAAEKARLQGQALSEKVTLLSSVLNSSAIDSVVGPSIASRAATGPLGVLGRFAAGATGGAAVGAAIGAPFGGVGAVPGAIAGGLFGGSALALQGAADYFSGASDKLVGQTEQFISKEFLNNLIDVKAQGATFGALTQKEQDALTAAATFIGQRRIYRGSGEDKQVVGYDMSESDFKAELGTILDLTRKAYEVASGNTWTSDEEEVWDALQSGEFDTQFNPQF